MSPILGPILRYVTEYQLLVDGQLTVAAKVCLSD